MGLLRQQAHPLLQRPPAAGHGGGRRQGRDGPGLGAAEGDQRPSVGGTLSLPQTLHGGGVTGQLTVLTGADGRQPHQRVPPVYHQARAPHHRPQGIAVAVMGGLVGQHMAQSRLIRRHLGRHIDALAQQARGVDGGGDVHIAGQISARVQRPAGAPQPGIAPAVHRQEPGQRHGAAADPHGGDDLRPRHGGGFRRIVLRRGTVRQRTALQHRRGQHAAGIDRQQRLRLPHQGDGRRGGAQAQIAGTDGEGQQQPGRRQQPQGIQHRRVQMAAQHAPQHQRRRHQCRRGQQPAGHGSTSSALRRMACSWSISCWVSCCFSVMALSSRPRLP